MSDTHFVLSDRTIQIVNAAFNTLGTGYAEGYPTHGGQRQEWVLRGTLATMPPHVTASFRRHPNTAYASLQDWRDAVLHELWLSGASYRYARVYSRSYTAVPDSVDYPAMPLPLELEAEDAAASMPESLRAAGFEPFEIRNRSVFVATRLTGSWGNLPLDVIATPYVVPAKSASGEVGTRQFDVKPTRITQNGQTVGYICVKVVTWLNKEPATTYEHFALKSSFVPAGGAVGTGGPIVTQVGPDPDAPTTMTLEQWQAYVQQQGFSAYAIAACRYYSALPANMGQIADP